MLRFFIPLEDIHTKHLHLRGQSARQVARVLRLKAGVECVILDNRGNEYLVSLEEISPALCSARILEMRVAEEPEVKLLMLLCLTQREKFEWMLQKCTEVGAAGFLPVISQLALMQDELEVRNKYERWEGIIREAAEQSGRGAIPKLHLSLRLEAAVQKAIDEFPLRLIPWEGEKRVNLKQALNGQENQQVAVLIGPEGGFAEDEVRLAVSTGFQSVTLGRRILRMETAAVVSAALIMHELGRPN